MNISFTNYLHQTIPHLEGGITSFISRQKVILVIAAAALVLVGVAFTAYRFLFKKHSVSDQTAKKAVPEEAKKTLLLSTGIEAKGQEVKRNETTQAAKESEQPVSPPSEKAKVEAPAVATQEKPKEEAPIDATHEKANAEPPVAVQEKTEEKSVEAKVVTPQAVEVEKNETKKLLIDFPILSFGKVRQSKKPGEPLPKRDFAGEEGAMTAAFASCFHTNESNKEILQLLKEICNKVNPISTDTRNDYYEESRSRLFQNLLTLHSGLIGESTKKEMKIYWSEAAEKELIPYLLKEDTIDLQKLSFALIPGEETNSPFQADKMNFKEQLQFVTIVENTIAEGVKLEYETDQLSQVVLGTPVYRLIALNKGKIFTREILSKCENVVYGNAFAFLIFSNLYQNLQKMKVDGVKLDFMLMEPDAKIDLLRDLLMKPSNEQKASAAAQPHAH